MKRDSCTGVVGRSGIFQSIRVFYSCLPQLLCSLYVPIFEKWHSLSQPTLVLNPYLYCFLFFCNQVYWWSLSYYFFLLLFHIWPPAGGVFRCFLWKVISEVEKGTSHKQTCSKSKIQQKYHSFHHFIITIIFISREGTSLAESVNSMCMKLTKQSWKSSSSLLLSLYCK